MSALKLTENEKIAINCSIKDKKATVNGTYSQTTLRHIKEFLKQEGFKAETQRQILNDYSEAL